jgi:hypothetical protein
VAKKSLLTKWYTDRYQEITNAKIGNMVAKGFGQILEGFPRSGNSVWTKATNNVKAPEK